MTLGIILAPQAPDGAWLDLVCEVVSPEKETKPGRQKGKEKGAERNRDQETSGNVDKNVLETYLAHYIPDSGRRPWVGDLCFAKIMPVA